VDNGSDHRGQAAAGRLCDAHPNAVMIHTPVHASWLNQVEIVFSVIQKKALTPGDFPGLGTLSYVLHAFVNRYNRTARPFNWKFTADGLTALLQRISQHEQPAASQRLLAPSRLITPGRIYGATRDLARPHVPRQRYYPGAARVV
jgi:hypothetical protein